jgi:hypothetical protein
MYQFLIKRDKGSQTSTHFSSESLCGGKLFITLPKYLQKQLSLSKIISLIVYLKE